MRLNLLARTSVGMLVAALLVAAPAVAQDVQADQRAAQAAADAALAAISKGDMAAFTDLMLPEAVLFPTSTRDGVTRYSARTRQQQRDAPINARVIERGWSPEIRINGPLAMVWYPYDLYRDGKWSHCGVDAFTLVKHEGRWRIATMAWGAEQPPACTKHPNGPPPGATP